MKITMKKLETSQTKMKPKVIYIFLYIIYILNLCLTKGCKSPEEESPTRGSSRRGSIKPDGSSRSPSLKGAKKKKVSKKILKIAAS